MSLRRKIADTAMLRGTGKTPGDSFSWRQPGFSSVPPRAFDAAGKQVDLAEFFEAIKFSLERVRKFRNNPYSKNPGVIARRRDKDPGEVRGGRDALAAGAEASACPGESKQDWLRLYARPGPRDRTNFTLSGSYCTASAHYANGGCND